MKIRDIQKLIERDGWRLDRTREAIEQFRHPTKSGTVTIAGHPADEVHKKTLRSILRQADLK